MNPYRTSCSKALAVAAVTVLAVVASASAASAQQKGPVTPTLVASIYEPGFNPYQASQTILFTNFSGTAILPVPPNQVVVIEQVSISGAVQSGGVVQAFLRCRNGDVEVNHSLVLFAQGEVNGLTQYAGNQSVKCYASAAPGTLNIHVQTSNLNTAQHAWVMAASGYTVQ